MTLDTDFLSVDPPSENDNNVEHEQDFFGSGKQPKSNTVFIPLWKDGHLAWRSESSAPVLSLIMLIILFFLLIIIASLSIAFQTKQFGDLFVILGNAISAVVGAVVGSASSSVRKQ